MPLRGRVSLHALRLVGPHGELDPVPGVQLGHETGEVELDGTRADVELLADLGVRPSSCDREEHFLFALCEGSTSCTGTAARACAEKVARSPMISSASAAPVGDEDRARNSPAWAWIAIAETWWATGVVQFPRHLLALLGLGLLDQLGAGRVR